MAVKIKKMIEPCRGERENLKLGHLLHFNRPYHTHTHTSGEYKQVMNISGGGIFVCE